MSANEWLEAVSGGVIIRIQAQPKASRSEVVGLHGTPPRLKVRIAAPPVDGEANEELLRFLKKLLRGPGVRLSLMKGSTSKTKEVFCEGVNPETASAILLEPKK